MCDYRGIDRDEGLSQAARLISHCWNMHAMHAVHDLECIPQLGRQKCVKGTLQQSTHVRPRKATSMHFKNTKGDRSTIDYFVASAQCFSAVKSLHVLDEAARYNSDHNPLLLHLAYKAPCDTHTHTSSAASDARIRYDVQKAEAYQACLATELQQQFIPLIQQELNVDVLCDRLEICSAKHYAASL